MKQMRIADFLEPNEIIQAIKLFNEVKESDYFALRMAKEIIEPVLPRINRMLGQENSAMYLAYAVEWALNQSKQ